jgi:hypothetical protein
VAAHDGGRLHLRDDPGRARDVYQLAAHERAQLLIRAAKAIWENRDLLDFSAAPSDCPSDMVYDLERIAERIHQYHSDQAQAALLDATEARGATLRLLQERRKIEQIEERNRRTG